MDDDEALLLPLSPCHRSLRAVGGGSLPTMVLVEDDELDGSALLLSGSAEVELLPPGDTTPKLQRHVSVAAASTNGRLVLAVSPDTTGKGSAERRTVRLKEVNGPTSMRQSGDTVVADPVGEAVRMLLFATQTDERNSGADSPQNKTSNDRCVQGGAAAGDGATLGTQRFAEAAGKDSIERTVRPLSGRKCRSPNVTHTSLKPDRATTATANPPPLATVSKGTPTPTSAALAQTWCPWRTLRDAPWDLEGWGIPPSVARVYRESFGVQRLFAWQRACLFSYFHALAEKMQNARTPPPPSLGTSTGATHKDTGHSCSNLLYSAPTSGGKTLVAEVMLLRRMLLLGEGHKAMFIVPYVSIAEEKTAALTALVQPMGKRVKCHAGHKGQRSLADDILVCTPEKANILVNLLIEKNRIEELCVVVVDELHQIGDANGGRGHLLEMLVTKLVLLSKEGSGRLQVVALSATLRNSEQLAQWMNGAQLFMTDFRPVPLEEYCVCQAEVLDSKGVRQRLLAPPNEGFDASGAAVPIHQPYLMLAREPLATDGQTLLFCPSRAMCERVAQELYLYDLRMMASAGASKVGPRLSTAAQLRMELAKRIGAAGGAGATEGRRSSTGRPDDGGARVRAHFELVKHGIAFHHAAISMEERALVEEGFRTGAIWALCCTTTLATGVNLPARRVVFTAPRIANQMLDAARYKQASGRAGRTGLDLHGEAYLCCRPQERYMCIALLSTALPPVTSNFSEERQGMMRVLLEGICSGTIQRVEHIEKTIRQTLLAIMVDDYSVIFHTTKRALEFLESRQLIAWDVSKESFHATLLGEAAVASSLAPDEALTMFQGLNDARNHLVLSHDVHLLFFCTPIYHGIEPDWSLYLRLVASLPRDAQEAMGLIGVSEAYLSNCATAPPPRHLYSPQAILHRRFYGTLILLDAVKEVPWSRVMERFHLPRQELQKLMEASATFSSMAATFCEKLNWWQFPSMFQHMASRLQRGVEPELVELMKIPGLMPWRARELFRRGFRTVLSVASAMPCELAAAMRVKAPFEMQRVAPPEDTLGGEHHRHNEGDVTSLIAVLQHGARAALQEEAAAMQDAIDEMHTAVPLLGNGPRTTTDARRGVKRERSMDGSIVDESTRALRPPVESTSGTANVNNHGAAGYRSIGLTWQWVGPHTSDDDWATMRSLVLSSASIALMPLSLLSAHRPLVALHLMMAAQQGGQHPNDDAGAGETIVVLDDGCVGRPRQRPAGATGADGGTNDWPPWYETHRTNHRSMRFLFHEVLPSPDITKVVSPAKDFWLQCFEAGWLHPHSAQIAAALNGRIEDPMIAEWLLAPEDRNVAGHQPTVATLAERIGVAVGVDPSLWHAADGASERHASRVAQLLFASNGPPPDHIGPMRRHLVECVLLHRVATRLRLRVQEADLLHVYCDVEVPIAFCLAQMEFYGIGFAPHIYQTYQQWMQLKARALAEEAYRVTSRSTWSLTSPKDCASMLFDVLKLPCLERTFDTKYLPNRGGKRRRERIGKESRSTKASVLKALSTLFPDCRLPAIIREHRTMHGWMEKYITPLLHMMEVQRCVGAPRRRAVTERFGDVGGEGLPLPPLPAPAEDAGDVHSIHGQFFQTATATGRLAMNDPNLQTIPHPIRIAMPSDWMQAPPARLLHQIRPSTAHTSDVVGEESGEDPPERTVALRLRSAFVARPGWTLISADYRQIEARLLAHFSGDPDLISAFCGPPPSTTTLAPGRDIFVSMASKLFHKLEVNITAEERRQAKTLCYAMLYGKGKASISDDLEISEDEAESILTSFRGAYPVAHEFLSTVASEACQRGFVETITKRKRWLPFAASTVPKFRAASARIAVNTLCQGSAADLVKLAMLKLIRHPLFCGPSPCARLVLQIHDELLVEARSSSVEEVVTCLLQEMSSVSVSFATTVPFPVSVACGANWADLVERTPLAPVHSTCH